MSVNTPSHSMLADELEALVASVSLKLTSMLAANAMAALGEAGQAVLWATSPWGSPRVVGIAGVSAVQRHIDFTNWFEAAAQDGCLRRQASAHDKDSLTVLDGTFASPRVERDRHLYLLKHTLHLRLQSPTGETFGGVFVTRATAPTDLQQELLSRYARAAGHALWNARQRSLWRRLVGGNKPGWRWTLLIAAAAAGSLLIPVRLSAKASVEITPRDAFPITAPQDGVIEKVLVRPNQSVKQGILLVRFNDSVDKSRLTVAKQNLAVARAELERTTNKSFQDPASRAELGTFRARVQEKTAEARFIEQMLERLVIRAPLDGAAFFADADEWVGRPVQKGERIMLVADPKKVWVTLFITPEEAIPDLEGAQVKVNLDIAPLESLHATVVESGYESVVMPDGRVGYLLRANLKPDQPLPRIGLKGMATLYGERTVLAYYLLRKPMRVMRRALGL